MHIVAVKISTNSCEMVNNQYIWQIYFRLDQWKIIKYPLTTEAAMKMIEDTNTLVFIVDKRANKPRIKDAVRKLYDIRVRKVNTLIRYAIIFRCK